MAATGRRGGRPPKPVEKKIAEGNLGKRKLPEAKIFESDMESVPPVPEHFSDEASQVWKKVWSGGASWMKAGRDFLQVELLCEAWVEYQYLRRMLKLGKERGGVDRVTLTEKGYPVQHPYVAQRNEAERKINTYCSSLALSPADFARLQLVEVSKEEKEKMDLLTSRIMKEID